VNSAAPPCLQRPLAEILQPLHSSDWWPVLQHWQASTKGQALMAAVDARVRAGAVVYPEAVFRALALTPLDRVRVLILGQDPYHGPGQAEGLAFSVPRGQRRPPSLNNIFKELRRDVGVCMPAGACSLVPWAQQGVLLLNTSLTVEAAQAGSHSKLGWQALTDAIIGQLCAVSRPVVFMLWGSHAHAMVDRLLRRAAEAPVASAAWSPANPEIPPPGSSHTALCPTLRGHPNHLFLRCNHPSPLSALRGPEPFIGCGHFGLANRWLEKWGEQPIDWQLVGP
jgi:uracil-DNA glycosylase